MVDSVTSQSQLLREIEELRQRLQETEETLHAIYSGQVDALVISGPQGPQVFTLKGIDYTYRRLVEQMTEGAVTLNSEGAILYSNRRFAEMVARPLEQVIGAPVDRFIVPRDREIGRSLLQRLGEGIVRAELDLAAADHRKPVLLSVSSLSSEDEAAICMVVTDLTEQKRHAEIVASERLARSILEQAAEAILVCDETGQIVRASQAVHELCGRNPLFWSFDRLFALARSKQARATADADRNNESFSVTTVLRGQSFHGEEMLLTRSDGQSTTVLLSANPLRDSAGEIIGCVIALVDISQRKEAENLLQAYSERLEEMVDERTQALRAAQEQLVRRERLAVLGQLAGGVGHELRTPLGAIKNAAYFLDMVLENPDAQVKEMVQIMQREVSNSDRIISTLLDFARPKAPERQSVDLVHLTQEVLARQSLPANIQVEFVPDPALPAVQADPEQLALVFANLIRNAAQAMRGGGHLTVGLDRQEGGVAICFQDTGVGMTAETLSHLFEPLFTTKARGIGLGLALSKQLVEGHGGRISASSQEGAGSHFVVWLPTDSSVESSAR